MFSLFSFIGQDDSDIVPAFLDHYRALGVTEFHIVLHGGWTGLELAPLSSPDVILEGIVEDAYSDEIRRAALEPAIKRFPEAWIIIVDADEFLELPYASITRTVAALACLGLDELPATLLQRAAPDGSLRALPEHATPSELFSSYDYLLAERMGVTYPIWKTKYPLVRVRPQIRLSSGFHSPHCGKSTAHAPIRGLVNHYKWRDRLRRSVGRLHSQRINRPEQDAYRDYLDRNGDCLPTAGLRPYRREAVEKAGYLIRPNRSELRLFAALRKVSAVSPRKAAAGLRSIQSIPSAATHIEHPELLDRRLLNKNFGRIALVTNDLLGLRRTGGIGTAMSALAERLAAAGHHVHVFLCPFAGSPTMHPAWIHHWESRGVRVRYFPRTDNPALHAHSNDLSVFITQVLSAGDWDVIHFPDNNGLAAATLLLRAAGLGLRNTQIVVTTHGPSRWARTGNLLPWTEHEAIEAELETISLQLADVVVHPSVYMMDWCARFMPCSAVQLVLPNILIGENRRFGRTTQSKRPVSKVVFFGRIELRKGIDTFISAIDLVLASGLRDFEVIFLGSLVGQITARSLQDQVRHWPCVVRMLHKYTAADAVSMLREDDCIAVIPSRVDNLPYTVYECVENGIPFVASDVGGVSELISPEDRERVLVRGEAEGYAEKLVDALLNGAAPARPNLDPTAAEVDMLALHGNLVRAARISRGEGKPRRDGSVTVIAHGAPPGGADRHRNRILERWAEDGLEIMADEGCLEPGREEAPQTSDRVLLRLNQSAEKAKGDCLFFCHASVQLQADTLDIMMETLRSAAADAVVCGYRVAPGGAAYSAFGGPPELSAINNVYGARVILIQKNCFIESGGFATGTDLSGILEWELLNRLKAAGRLIVGLPFPLLTVRDAAAAPLAEHQRGRLATPWLASMPDHLRGLARMALHPERKHIHGNGGKAQSELRPKSVQLSEVVLTAPKRTGTAVTRPADDHKERERSGKLQAPDAHLLRPSGDWVQDWSAATDLWDIGRSYDGRLLIGPNGVLREPEETYRVHDAEDAAGCDFIVQDHPARFSELAVIAQTYRSEANSLIGCADGPGYIWLTEISHTRPDVAESITGIVRNTIATTTDFYGTKEELHPDLVRMVQVPAGNWLSSTNPFSPKLGPNRNLYHELNGCLCIGEEFEGGSCYFHNLDIEVQQKPGRLIVATATAYHERTVLRVTSGKLLMLSFVMTSAPHAPAW